VDYRAWETPLLLLSERYRVIALSLRHYYPEKWDGQGGTFTIQQHAADVIAFIEALRLTPVHLLGHLRGGNVALHVAKSQPSLLRTLILAEASGLEILLPQQGHGQSDVGRGPAMRRAVVERLQAQDLDGALNIYVDSASGPGAWVKLPEERRQVMRDNAWTVVGDVGDRPQTTCDEGARMTMPVLLLSGEVSPPRFGQMLDLFQHCVKTKERLIIPGASHGMFLTHPQDSSRAVLSFLAKH